MFTGALSFKTFAQQNHGHCHRSQAQGWIDGLHRADPHYAKGCDSLSGSQTFDRKATAQAWIKGVETEMSVWLDEVNILLPGYEHAVRILPRP